MQIPHKFMKAAYTGVPAWRSQILRWFASTETRLESQRAAALGINQQATWDELSAAFRDRTVFLLGSGWSIRLLDDKRLSTVSEQASIALNTWPSHHSFVANYYLVETSHPKQWKDLESIVSCPGFRGILASQFLNDGHQSSSERITRVPHSLTDLTYWYTSLPAIGLTPSAYRASIRAMLRADFNPKSVVTGPRSTSIERAMTLVAAAGANEIVLCGIDLSGPYFWETDEHDRPHKTNARPTFIRSASQRLRELIQVIQSERGGIVFLADSVGELSGDVPAYLW